MLTFKISEAMHFLSSDPLGSTGVYIALACLGMMLLTGLCSIVHGIVEGRR